LRTRFTGSHGWILMEMAQASGARRFESFQTAEALERTAKRTLALELAAVQQRALGGVISLAGREVVIKLLQLVGGIIIARELAPQAFGLFAIGYFSLNLFAMFSELGLGAALIRKPGEVSRHELDALFTFQLIFVCVLASGLFLGAPLVARLYRANDVIWVLRALSVCLVLISLRTVPIVVTERRLSYGPIALSDVLRQVAFWLIAVAAAFSSWGVWSLVVASVVSAGVGTGSLYISTRWKPLLQFDWRSIRSSLRFGVIYQGQSVTNFAKDSLIPSLGILFYGTTAVGYLTWAQQISFVPLVLTTLVARVSYPALARLQHDSRAFLEMLGSTLRWTCRVSLPIFAMMMGLAPQIIHFVYGPKWLPAERSLYLLFLNGVLSMGTGLLVPALYSLGRAGVGLRISLLWTLTTWFVAMLLALVGMGFEALPIAYAVGSLLALGLIGRQVRRLGSARFVRELALPIATAVGVGALLRVTAPALIHGPPSLAAVALISVVFGLLVNLWSDRSIAIGAMKSAASMNFAKAGGL
jgi:O-antigen/teichoic acid export membrane protein